MEHRNLAGLGGLMEPRFVFVDSVSCMMVGELVCFSEALLKRGVRQLYVGIHGRCRILKLWDWLLCHPCILRQRGLIQPSVSCKRVLMAVWGLGRAFLVREKMLG